MAEDNGLWAQVSRNPDTNQIIPTGNAQKERNVSNELDKNAFLQLLITQLQYQDPLNPMEDKEFISQMAQFSALEQMQNMYKASAQSQAYAMIGKNITASYYNEQTKGYVDVDGTVSAVVTKSGSTYLRVGNDDVPIDAVESVSDGGGLLSSINTSMVNNQIMGLIGKYVQAILLDAEGNPTEFVEGKVDYVQFSGSVPILMVGDKEVYANEVATVSDSLLLVGKPIQYQKFNQDANAYEDYEGLVESVKISNEQAYLLVDGEEIAIEKINYVTDALRLLGTKVDFNGLQGTVNAIVVKEGIPFLKVDETLLSFKDYKGIV